MEIKRKFQEVLKNLKELQRQQLGILSKFQSNVFNEIWKNLEKFNKNYGEKMFMLR